MKLELFGKKRIEICHEGGNWILYSLSEGKRLKLADVVIPGHFSEDEAIVFLADLFHEAATPEFPDIKRID